MSVFYYFKDKNDKEYNEYYSCLSDIIEDISYHISFIKDDEMHEDTKVHIKSIERLCNKVQDEINDTI